MLKELENLISFIQNEYLIFNKQWQRSTYYSKVNLRNNTILKLLENESILENVFNYREFINANNIQLSTDFMKFNNEKVKVNIRTKAKNSIEYKIKNYVKNHENGKIPINKCLNDLFGIRMICKEDLTHEQIEKLIKDNYKDLKCINSSKLEYKATHIYFKEDNYNFEWELQIWNSKDEYNNIKSHEIYKQDYVKWEKENK